MYATFWSPTDPYDGAIAAGFDVAVGAVTREDLVEKRLVIPGLSHAYSAASQGRGGWYNSVSRPVLVRRGDQFIGESVDTGYAPIGIGAVEDAETGEALEDAHEAWWRQIRTLPAHRRTPVECLRCALLTARDHGVEREVAEGLVQVLGLSTYNALVGAAEDASLPERAYEGAQRLATSAYGKAQTFVESTPAAQLYQRGHEYVDPTYFDPANPNKGLIAQTFDKAGASIAAAGDPARATLAVAAKTAFWSQAKLQPSVQSQPDALLVLARRMADQFQCRTEFDAEWVKVDPSRSLWDKYGPDVPDLPGLPDSGPIVVAVVASAALIGLAVVLSR